MLPTEFHRGWFTMSSSSERVVAPLQRVPLFASLKAEQLAEIAQRAEKLRFRAGDVITHAGTPADGAYLIVSGQAERLEQSNEGEREAIEPGSMIAEMAMLIDQEYHATVVARDRVLVLPQRGHDDYLRVNLACDAMLDSVRWSGGNTSLDAIACGLPIATRPGAFMRARQSAAMLRIAGVPELVADDEDGCVAIAARLAADRDWREAVSGRMVAGAEALFDDTEPIEALAAFLGRG